MTSRRIPLSGVIGLLVLAGVLFTPRAFAASLSIVPGFGSYLAAAVNYFGGVTVYTAPERLQPAAVALAEGPAPGVREAATAGDLATAEPATTRVVYEYLPATSTPAVTVTASGVTEVELEQKLAALQTALQGEIKNISGTPPLTSSGILQGFQMLGAATGDSTGATLRNVTVDGVTGLTGSDLPDLSGTYLSLSKGGTVSGNLTVTGAFTGGTLSLTNASTSALTVAGPAYFGGTATSTFTNAGWLGIASTSPSAALDVNGDVNISANNSYQIADTPILSYGGGNSSSNLAIGPNALSNTTGGCNNIAVGSGALENLGAGACGNVGVGVDVLSNGGGYRNVAIGLFALVSNVSGGYNVGVGWNALNANTTENNVAVGAAALRYTTTGEWNAAVGTDALQYNTTGQLNAALGDFALGLNTTGSKNAVVGEFALVNNTSATNTVAIGAGAAGGAAQYHNQGGVYAGYQAGYDAATGSDYNTLLGYQAGRSDTTGAYNIVLGAATTTGVGITTGSGNILIGNGVDAGLNRTGSNQLNIGNLIFGTGLTSSSTLSGGNVGIGTTNPSHTLTVANSGSAQLQLDSTGSQGGIFLTNNGTKYGWIGNGNLAIGTLGVTDLGIVAKGDLALGGNGGNDTVHITSTGNVGIGTTSPWKTLSVNGTVAMSGLTTDTADAKTLCLTADNEVVANAGSSCITSSERFKEDIQPLATSSGLAEVLNLNPVSFKYKPAIGISGEQVGFIAEQVRPLDERLVVLDASGTPFTVRYENLTAILAKAIQQIASISGEFKDALVAWFGDAENGIGDLYAGVFHGREADVQKLCVGSTCVDQQQLAALLAGSASAQSSQTSPADTSSTASRTQQGSDAPSCTLAADPGQVAPGDHTVFSWAATNADTFSIDQGIGAVTPAESGSTTSKAINADTTFTGTATSPTGKVTTCTAAVSVMADSGAASSSAPSDATGSTTPTTSTDTASTTQPSPEATTGSADTATTSPKTSSGTASSSPTGEASSTPAIETASTTPSDPSTTGTTTTTAPAS